MVGRTVLIAAILVTVLPITPSRVLAVDTDGDGLLDLLDAPGFDPNASGSVFLGSLGIQDLDGAKLLTSAQELLLHYNKISSIENGDFGGLTNLGALYLIDNQVANIDAGAFQGLTNLQELWLTGNPITAIEQGDFDGLNNLGALYLSGNQIANVAPGAFRGLTNLQELWLQGNSIKTIEPGAFAGLSELQQLYLSGNSITSLEPGAFEGLNNLQWLDLIGNQIKSIERGDFDGLNNLFHLSLTSNRITSHAFEGLTSLAGLTLDSGPLASIENGAFYGLFSLSSLFGLGFGDEGQTAELNFTGATFDNLGKCFRGGGGFCADLTFVSSLSLDEATLSQQSFEAIYYHTQAITDASIVGLRFSDGAPDHLNGLLQIASLNNVLVDPHLYSQYADEFMAFDAQEGQTVTIIPDGDFDRDTFVTVMDIDALSMAVRETPRDPIFDLNDDGVVSNDDRTMWVHDVKRTYFGDANLDGEFNSGDFTTVFLAGEYEDTVEDNSGWADGDWDGDGDFTSQDMVTAFLDGGYEQGPRPAAAVPEPANVASLVILACLLFSRATARRCPHTLLGITVVGLATLGTVTHVQAQVNVVELGAREIAEGYANGSLTAVEVTQAFLDRIEKYEPAYNAFVSFTPDILEIARSLDEEYQMTGPRSPLHGVPIVIKEAFDVAGLPSTAGYAPFSSQVGGVDLIPNQDAPVVARLRDAGAIILGKTNIPAFSADGTRANSSCFGPTFNAFDRTLAPGASSSGTATAVSASFAVLGMAEETGGSIQNPAAAQGLVGVKPTFGLVPNTGVVPLAGSTRDVLGPHAKTVYDAAITLDAIAGYTPDDDKTLAAVGKIPAGGYTSGLSLDALRGKRIGLFGNGWRSATLPTETRTLYEAATNVLLAEGATLVEDPFSGSGFANLTTSPGYDFRGMESIVYDYEQYLERLLPTGAENSLAELKQLTGVDLFAPGGPLSWARDFRIARESLKNPDLAPDLSEFFAVRNTFLELFTQVMDSADLDALVFPQMGARTPTLAGTQEFDALTVDEINILGTPGVTVPAGYFQNGGPFSLIFLGRPFSEAELLGYAFDYEQASQQRIAPVLGVLGDFNANGFFDVGDIDALTTKVRGASNDLAFDLNSDRRTDYSDTALWIKELARTYLGDANVDGEFNSNDFVTVFLAGEYEDERRRNSTWSEGDWDGDGDFTSGDFVAAFLDGGYEQGPRPTAVPEPSAPGLLLVGGLLLVRGGRRCC